MKSAALLLVVTLLAVFAGLVTWEVSWRFDHSRPRDVASSDAGHYVAQARDMPEGSEMPYGDGIFVRHRYIPLWATSKLVFAGYCKPEVGLAWPEADQLIVSCIVVEGSVKRFPPPSGITVLHDDGA